MNINKRKKILFNTILIILIMFIFSNVIFAENELNSQDPNMQNAENNTTTQNTETNTVRPLTLQEQQNQVSEQLSNANEQLEYVESEISSKLVSIARIEDRINEYQVSLDKVNLEYTTIQKEVFESEKRLAEVQEKYNKKDKALKDKLIAVYEKGTMSYLDVLLNSRNIIEFVSNYFLVQTIVEYDSKQIADINKTKQQVEQINNELQEKKSKAKLLKIEAETQTVIWENTKTILENEKASLDDREQSLLAEIDSYKRQQQEINYLISYSIGASTYQLKYSGGVMIWPTVETGYITSQFGSRVHPIQGIVKNHDGIDIGVQMNAPIYAAQDGIIIYYGWMGGYGNAVMIDHGINDQGVKVVTLYGHGNELLPTLSVGMQVKQGQEIMKAGSTGNSTGPHVHFEVRENGIVVDPKKYLSNQNNEEQENDENINNVGISN